jgi:hypothetical protein
MTMLTSGYSERNNPVGDKTLTPVKIPTGKSRKKTISLRVQARIYHQTKKQTPFHLQRVSHNEKYFCRSAFFVKHIDSRTALA